MGNLFSHVFKKRQPDKPGPDPQGFYEGPPMPWYWTPRVISKTDYPLDADGGMRWTRPKVGIDFFPSPYVENTADGKSMLRTWVNGTMPMNNLFVAQSAIGKNPSGPMLYFNEYADSFGIAQLPQARKVG